MALSKDETDIAVVFRGTVKWQEWISNLTDLLSCWDDLAKTEPSALPNDVWVEKVSPPTIYLVTQMRALQQSQAASLIVEITC